MKLDKNDINNSLKHEFNEIKLSTSEQREYKSENDEENINLLVSKKNQKLSKRKYLKEIFSKMKFTKSHFFMILSIFLIKTAEGTEILALSISSMMIEKNFQLKPYSSSLINVVILSGNLIGCLLTMFSSNKFGRKFYITVGGLLVMIFGFISICSHKIEIFVMSRLVVNIGIGFVIPGAVSLITESVNSGYRGFVLNLILVSGSVGEFIISLSLGTIVDLENSHEWSRIFLIAVTPVVSLFLFTLNLFIIT